MSARKENVLVERNESAIQVSAKFRAREGSGVVRRRFRDALSAAKE